MPHEHKWGRGYREVDVPVIDGVATMPDGRTIESTANIVRYPEPIDDFVCGVCGATRDTPAEHSQTRPTNDEIRRTGVRFTVAQLNDMADAAIQGQTPPPLSFNENVLLMALYRQRLEATR